MSSARVETLVWTGLQVVRDTEKRMIKITFNTEYYYCYYIINISCSLLV